MCEANVKFNIQGLDSHELYAYFPAYFPNSTAAKKLECFVDGRSIGTHFNGEESGYLCLGAYASGQTCTMSIRLDSNPFYCYTPYFYALDEEVYERLISTLSAGGYEVTECREDFFSGSITVQEGYTTVLTTIPYDRGWRITVDGVEIEGYETLDALLAFDLAPGEHTLTLRYLPREYVTALAISLLGGGVLAALLLGELIKKRRNLMRAAAAAGKDKTICSTISEEN